jgi:glucose/arabinose dehydrogenase
MKRAAALLIALALAGCASNPPGSLLPTAGSPSTGSSAAPTTTPSSPTAEQTAATLAPQTPATPAPQTPATPAGSMSPPSASPAPGSSAGAPGPFDPHALRIDIQPFAQGLDAPVFVTGTGDGTGRLFVLEQPGRIRIVGGDGSVAATPLLDIAGRLVSGGERGLLGLALHPDFTTNGRLFVDYTRSPDGATVISEFRAKGDSADPASEQILLTIPQPFSNHNGGMLAFDSSGMLVIGMGDGGSAGDPQANGQNREALLGKLLRIDVDGRRPYDLPRDNPFLHAANTRPEIWDLGMRNPWRFSFDRQTGDLFIGDVGQDSWEEIDVERAGTGGLDYGWNLMEARHCVQSDCDPSGLTLPVAEYSHADGCSVTGGYVYRGSKFPLMFGGYLFSDYCSGTIWAFPAVTALANGSAAPVVVGSAGFSVSSFGQGDDGELYVADLAGRVLKVVVIAAT